MAKRSHDRLKGTSFAKHIESAQQHHSVARYVKDPPANPSAVVLIALRIPPCLGKVERNRVLARRHRYRIAEVTVSFSGKEFRIRSASYLFPMSCQSSSNVIVVGTPKPGLRYPYRKASAPEGGWEELARTERV
jgi:hypothetical protein